MRDIPIKVTNPTNKTDYGTILLSDLIKILQDPIAYEITGMALMYDFGEGELEFDIENPKTS